MIHHPHVVLNEKGTPVIKGTRVPVHRLYYWQQKGIAVAALVKRYPSLGWAKVLDALSFAYDHQDLMEKAMEDERRSLEEPKPTWLWEQLELFGRP